MGHIIEYDQNISALKISFEGELTRNDFDQIMDKVIGSSQYPPNVNAIVDLTLNAEIIFGIIVSYRQT